MDMACGSDLGGRPIAQATMRSFGIVLLPPRFDNLRPPCRLLVHFGKLSSVDSTASASGAAEESAGMIEAIITRPSSLGSMKSRTLKPVVELVMR
jgi:hypothetical protein